MTLRKRTFGLSVEGSTAAATFAGLTFESTVGDFEKYLEANHSGVYLFTKDLTQLPSTYRDNLEQFFALSSSELASKRPASAQIGDIYRDNDTQVVMIYTDREEWKQVKEGIAPDRVLMHLHTRRIILIEAKYGDTEGNAHIERAGARATPGFLGSIDKLFGEKARCLYIFSGPMVTARGNDLGPKVAKRGGRKGEVVQSAERRRYASARYQRQIEVLFSGHAGWTLLWDENGPLKMEALFEKELRPFLES